MRHGTGRQRGGSRTEGVRGVRVLGSGEPGQDRDLGTEIEDELLSSGRAHFMPREGLVGAHEERREGLGRVLDSGTPEPVGRGAEVAPTRKAEIREHARHERQRHLGVVPAGENGSLRQQRAPGVSRTQLDRAGQDADQQLTDEQQEQFQKELYDDQRTRGEAAKQQDRAAGGGWRHMASAWLGAHRAQVALVAALMAAAYLTAVARSRT